jgi:hypothetical protein
VLRRVLVLRGFAAVLPDDFAAPLLARFAVERFAGDLRAVDERLAPVLADFARVEVDFFAVDLRAPVDRFAVDFRAGFDAVLLELAVEVLAEPSIDHLPDITRCAASATASAMIEPSLVALDTTLLAALSAVSAASRPASRIFLRAAGLALIAAAAAARPAASISLLIAALANLSTVALFDAERDDEVLEREPDELEELLRADFAIFYLPPLRTRHSKGCSGSLMISDAQSPDMLKGTVASKRRCPSTWSAAGDVAVRQHLGPTNTPFRPPC